MDLRLFVEKCLNRIEKNREKDDRECSQNPEAKNPMAVGQSDYMNEVVVLMRKEQ